MKFEYWYEYRLDGEVKSMKYRISLLLSLLIVVIALLSTACAPANLVAPAITPEPSTTVAATPTATPSPEPTATPVATLSPEEQAALLDQQFQDFLNKEGEYTVEKIEEYCPIWGSRLCYEDGNGTNLGILKIFKTGSTDKYDDSVSVYGYLYSVSRNVNSNIILTMGFDGKDGNRFNSVLMILSNCFDAQTETDDEKRFGLSFGTEEGLHLDDKYVRQFRATRSDEIYKYLENLIGKKIVAVIAAKKVNLDELNNSGAKIFWKESNNRLPFTYNLISKLANNGIDTSAVGSSGKDIPLITNSSDLNNVDFDTVPLVRGIRFRENG